MRVRGPTVVLLLAVTVARADDQPQPLQQPAGELEPQASTFVAGGLLLGGDRYLNGAFFIEGGIALPQRPIWLHFMASYGTTQSGLSFSDAGGRTDLEYVRAIAGVELRFRRLFIDLDAGYQHQSGVSSGAMETHRGPWIGSRIGLELGGAVGIQGRLALEVYKYHDTTDTSEGRSVTWEDGFSLVASLGFQR